MLFYFFSFFYCHIFTSINIFKLFLVTCLKIIFLFLDYIPYSSSSTYSTGELDLIIIKVSSAENITLPVSQGEVRVKVLAENDSPVLMLENGILSDGSASASSSSSTSTSSSYEILTEDMLSLKTVSTSTMYTTENVPLFINNTSVRDVDCTNSTFLRIVLTPTNGNISIHFPENDPLNPFKSLGLFFQEGTGTNDPKMTLLGPISTINLMLKILIFIPTYKYSGTAGGLIITVDDLGNLGLGDSKFDTQVKLL